MQLTEQTIIDLNKAHDLIDTRLQEADVAAYEGAAMDGNEKAALADLRDRMRELMVG